MINKDDLADDPLFSGRGKCLQIVPDRLLETGIPFGKSRATECWTKGTGDETADWSRMYAFIPEETSLTDIAFQFDVYVPDAWSNTGQIQICLMNNFNFLGVGSDDDGQRTAFFVPYINDGKMVPFRTESWQTVTIPFSEFGAYAKALGDSETIDPTFRTIVEDRLAATYQNFGMGFVNTDFTLQGINIESTLFNQKIYIDNWRIVPCAKISVSDFNDEEENDTENDIE